MFKTSDTFLLSLHSIGRVRACVLSESTCTTAINTCDVADICGHSDFFFCIPLMEIVKKERKKERTTDRQTGSGGLKVNGAS